MMFKSYPDIFNQRGTLYHQAMLKYPLARVEEFNQIVSLSDLEDRSIVCDIPYSSMGHEGSYLTTSTKQELESVGFQVVYDASKAYYWHLLLGIDRGNEEQVLAGIEMVCTPNRKY